MNIWNYCDNCQLDVEYIDTFHDNLKLLYQEEKLNFKVTNSLISVTNKYFYYLL